MWNVIGHQRAVASLQRALEGESFPHALLLVGPHAVGKTHLALELAKALNCTGEGRPCQTCLHCRQIGSGSHPDVTVVEAAEGKDSITIGQVRELRESASLRPFQGRTKVYVIAGAEALTLPAADALLKTLEEPQKQVVIVLTAVDRDALPATVVSRCRVMTLSEVDAGVVAGGLEEHGQDTESAATLARLSRGRPGWALQASRQPKLVQQQEELVSQLARVPDMELDERLRLAERLAADRKDRSSVRRSLELLLLLARDMLLVGQGLPPDFVAAGSETASMGRATQYTLPEIHQYLQGIRLAMERIDQNVDPRLTLEALLAGLP